EIWQLHQSKPAERSVLLRRRRSRCVWHCESQSRYHRRAAGRSRETLVSPRRFGSRGCGRWACVVRRGQPPVRNARTHASVRRLEIFVLSYASRGRLSRIESLVSPARSPLPWGSSVSRISRGIQQSTLALGGDSEREAIRARARAVLHRRFASFETLCSARRSTDRRRGNLSFASPDVVIGQALHFASAG